MRPTEDNSRRSPEARRRLHRTVKLLVLIALLIYLGFIGRAVLSA